MADSHTHTVTHTCTHRPQRRTQTPTHNFPLTKMFDLAFNEKTRHKRQLLRPATTPWEHFFDHMGKQELVQKQKGGTNARRLTSCHCLWPHSTSLSTLPMMMRVSIIVVRHIGLFGRFARVSSLIRGAYSGEIFFVRKAYAGEVSYSGSLLGNSGPIRPIWGVIRAEFWSSFSGVHSGIDCLSGRQTGGTWGCNLVIFMFLP